MDLSPEERNKVIENLNRRAFDDKPQNIKESSRSDEDSTLNPEAFSSASLDEFCSPDFWVTALKERNQHTINQHKDQSKDVKIISSKVNEMLDTYNPYSKSYF